MPICPLFQLRIRHKIYPLYYYHTSKANMHFPILSVVAVLVLHSQMRQGLGSVQTAVINISGKYLGTYSIKLCLEI